MYQRVYRPQLRWRSPTPVAAPSARSREQPMRRLISWLHRWARTDWSDPLTSEPLTIEDC